MSQILYFVGGTNEPHIFLLLGKKTRAIMTGLMLHASAKQLIKRQEYEDALELLAMGEVCHGVLYLTIFDVQLKSNILVTSSNAEFVGAGGFFYLRPKAH